MTKRNWRTFSAFHCQILTQMLSYLNGLEEAVATAAAANSAATAALLALAIMSAAPKQVANLSLPKIAVELK